MLGATRLGQLRVSSGDGREGFKGVEVSGLTLYLSGVNLGHVVGVLPESLDDSIVRQGRGGGVSAGSGNLAAESTGGQVVAPFGGT